MGEPSWKLGLYRFENEAWVLVDGSGPIDDHFVSGQIRQLGVYQVRLDPDRRFLPSSSSLHQNSPNPFTHATTITYDLATNTEVTLRVYGVDGRLIRELVRGMRPRGRHEVVWGGVDESERAAPVGVYFCRLEAGGFSESKKMILVQ